MPALPPRRRPPLLHRLSAAYTDIVLLAQLAGAAANFLWYTELSTTDLVGFIYLGGDMAGLLAYFGFTAFGILFFITAPRRFWRTLHPATFGIALLLLASHRLWNANPAGMLAATAAGIAAGVLLRRPILRHPRTALLACATILFLLTLTRRLSRHLLPHIGTADTVTVTIAVRAAAPYAITLLGALLIALPLLPALRRRRP